MQKSHKDVSFNLHTIMASCAYSRRRIRRRSVRRIDTMQTRKAVTLLLVLLLVVAAFGIMKEFLL